MRDKILDALFVSEGRLFGVRSFITLGIDAALIAGWYAGLSIPDPVAGIAILANTFYFGERSAKLLTNTGAPH